MLQRALKLRPRLSLFIDEAIEKDLNPADSISKDDWTTLQTVHDLLKPFWKLTLRLQGQASNCKYGAIWEVLPAMEFLINHLEASSKIYTHRKAKHIHICINNALMKLCEYYQLLNTSPIYATSVVLNPAIKERHFDRNWRGSQEAWVLSTKEDVRNFWVAEYKDKVITGLNPVPEISQSESSKVNEYEDFENYMYNLSPALATFDEYDSYCKKRFLLKIPLYLIQY